MQQPFAGECTDDEPVELEFDAKKKPWESPVIEAMTVQEATENMPGSATDTMEYGN